MSHHIPSCFRSLGLLALPALALVVTARADTTFGDLPNGILSSKTAELSSSDWSSIRAAYEAGRHAFHAVEGGGWQTRNPGQQWTTKFDGRGFLAEPRAGGWQWGLELKDYGFVGQERRHERPAVVSAQGQRLAYAWDGKLEEWFLNDHRGLEHGFTVKERPPLDCGSLLPLSGERPAARQDEPCRESHPGQQAAFTPKRQRAAAVQGYLSFTLGVRGGLRPAISADAQAVNFLNEAGASVLTYSGLKVWDADGKALPSRFESAGEKSLRLLVDERAARYPITIDPIAQQAYLKASNTNASDFFGSSVALSGDTVVVGAPLEDSNATGVNAPLTGGTGTQEDNSASNSGAAYVFVRSGGVWTQQAYLKASNTGVGDFFGASVAVSGDTVVVGAGGEDSNATGVNAPLSGGSGTQADNSASNAGAAYVFVRSGGLWTQQAYLKASNTGTEDSFGLVAVSGDTVVVGAYQESSNATGVNAPLTGGSGTQANNSAFLAGAAYVFVRSSGLWTQQAYLKASNTGVEDRFGWSVAVSGDTVVVGAINEDSNATGVNAPLTGGSGTQADNSVIDSGAAYVFVRSGGVWTQQAYLKASNTDANDWFGERVALSGDTLVVGTYEENSNATGVNAPLSGGSGTQADNSAVNAGAAYIFARSGGVWTQQAYLKASNTEAQDNFGSSVAVSGDTVVVGARFEDSNATGVNAPLSGGTGTQADNSASAAGAAYVFTRSGGVWTQQAYLKASNTGAGDSFGGGVAVSGDTVVVAASGEASNATGVNAPLTGGTGTQADNSASSAGAAYVFTDSVSLTPLQSWRQTNFGISANTGNAANDFDFEGDGWKNLVEYGVNTNPTTHGETGLNLGLQAYSGSEYLRTIFTRDPARNDVTINVQVADSPAGPWTTVASSVNGAVTTGAGFVAETDIGGGLKQVEVRDTVPSTGAARRFLRITVSE